MDLIMAYRILNDLVVVDKDYFLQLIPAVLLEQMDYRYSRNLIRVQYYY